MQFREGVLDEAECGPVLLEPATGDSQEKAARYSRSNTAEPKLVHRIGRTKSLVLSIPVDDGNVLDARKERAHRLYLLRSSPGLYLSGQQAMRLRVFRDVFPRQQCESEVFVV